jgi:putative FmdB family regulatory protein
MPIYAYRCAACGFQKDHLQKLSDAALCVCPECGQTTYSKQVTAAGFQLKGSGWYATDFKGGNNNAPATTEKPENKEPAPVSACATGATACADS